MLMSEPVALVSLILNHNKNKRNPPASNDAVINIIVNDKAILSSLKILRNLKASSTKEYSEMLSGCVSTAINGIMAPKLIISAIELIRVNPTNSNNCCLRLLSIC